MLKNRIRILLAERDLKIKDLMTGTGLSRPSVSNMVNNRSANISTKNLDKLLNYFDITPNEFWEQKKD